MSILKCTSNFVAYYVHFYDNLERGSSFAGSMKSCFSFSNDLAFTPSDNFTDTWYSRIVPKISSIFPIWRICFKSESCYLEKGRTAKNHTLSKSHLCDVFQVNGGIEVGNVLDAGLDDQVLLTGVGEGAKRHHPLWWTLVISTPATSSSSSSTPEAPSTSITSSEATTTSTTAAKTHDSSFSLQEWQSVARGSDN